MSYKTKNIQIINGQRFRKCTGNCQSLKLEIKENFRIRKYDDGSTYFNAQCKVCELEYEKSYEQNIRKPKREVLKQPKPELTLEEIELKKEKRKDYLKQYKIDHPTPLEKKKKYRENYKENHHEEILVRDRVRSKTPKAKEKSNKRRKERLKSDPKFKWRVHFSSLISTALKEKGTSKNGQSTFDLLGYTLEDLLVHLTAGFSRPENLTPDGKIWMTLENYGAYITEGPNAWKDDDILTHRWSLDHEIPLDDFKYSSPNDPQFKEAWALKNLRPYSAKQNVLDGARRTRHKKKDPK